MLVAVTETTGRVLGEHGGRIGLDDSSIGSKFWFTLPKQAAKHKSGKTPTRDIDPIDDSFVQKGGESGRLIRAFDWSTTCLGPMSGWPQSLRTSVSTMLRSPYPIILFWGKDLVMLYNDPFCPILGEKHPGTVGASGAEALAEAWEILGPLMAKALSTGEPLYVENGAVFFAGLALAHELVELHGGNLSVSSELGKGTVFTVRVPRGSAHLAAHQIGHAPQSLASVAAASFAEEASRWTSIAEQDVVPVSQGLDDAAVTIPAHLASSRILLVDDNADLRSYVAGLLGRAFPNVETATNGREALDRARACPPNLILSDVMMPIMDGFELVKALRSDERTRSVPIILLSARTGDEFTIEGLDSGADDYLVKPFSSRELLARVRSQLETASVRAEVWSERARIRELLRSAAARDEFLSLLAHELRTPLTALALQLEVLLRSARKNEPGAAPRWTEKLELAMRQTDRLMRLFDTLLDASRIAMGKLELSCEEADLAELVRRVVERLEPDARARGTTFGIESSPVVGTWDRGRIEQVIDGLLSNAMKYAPGTKIDVVVRPRGEDVQLSVRDAGIGIAHDKLSRIFDRFERGVSADHYGGFGFGLFLARQFVEAHGGQLRAESTLGKGSTFTVTLPTAPSIPRRTGAALDAIESAR